MIFDSADRNRNTLFILGEDREFRVLTADAPEICRPFRLWQRPHSPVCQVRERAVIAARWWPGVTLRVVKDPRIRRNVSYISWGFSDRLVVFIRPSGGIKFRAEHEARRGS